MSTPEFDPIPLMDSLDHDILMHRDAHFGGQFPIMLDYYRREGKGVNPEISVERIERLAELEKLMNQNLAPLILSGVEAEKIADARKAYKTLRDIYEIKHPKFKHPRLIADLILSEDDEPESEIAAIVAEKEAIVPALVDLLRKEEIYDPLFPGYGIIAGAVVKCLGLIGDKRAIITLFEAVGEGDFFTDDNIVRALKEIGEPAKKFLLTVVAGLPLTADNEKAAIALIAFKDDPEVAVACFNLLKKPEIIYDPCLSTYLALTCSGLENTPYREEFTKWVDEPSLPRQLRADIREVVKGWAK